MRLSAGGVLAGMVYLLLAVSWLLWFAPASPLAFWVVLWPLALAVLGSFIAGIANQVTLSRAYLALPGLLYALNPNAFLALAATVTLAGLTDLVDGSVARRLREAGSLGGGLDPLVDGVFYGGVAIGLALSRLYPDWLAAVVVARYALPALAAAALLALGRRPELRHTLMGQVSTTLIAMLLGGAALFRALGVSPRAVVVAAEIVIPLAALLTFAHLAWGRLAGPRRGVNLARPR